MQNVPHAVCRLDSAGNRISGYLIVSPHYVELRRLDSDETLQLIPQEPVTSRLWQELLAMARDETPRLLQRSMGEEAFLLAEELTRDSAFLLTVEPITLAAPRFAADRLSHLLRAWVEAECAGVPFCPFKCRLCGNRLEKTDSSTMAPPSELPRIGYSCQEHQSQGAEYDPALKVWTDTRN